ncbi:MAG: amino acid permease [Gammaproteobacteria bacterium]|nr:MAG: amino acid permease [Gammaproteobacteria bacterium]TDJ34584.1 MAG: amino acid permease [Gammaproteobacteria bacterium]
MAVVIANMIGTGVFTSLGFQLADIQSGFVLMMLWVVGGLTALCGAFTYAELGAALPRSGGEYNFLSQIYHPGAGFVSGWISATIGFAAPTALAAITFGTYLASVFPSLSPTWLACGLVFFLTVVHTSSRRNSGALQRLFTSLKILLILAFCLLCWILVDQPQSVNFLPARGDGALLTSSAFAVSLIYVNYAYTGWNAATYLTGELDRPQQNLSKVLILGTSIVLVCYVLLNFTFLYVAPMDAMVGKLEIGYITAKHVLGDSGAGVMGVLLAFLLVSTASAMILAGPRVLQVIGQDFPAFRFLARTNKHDVPHIAITMQSLLSVVFILSASFESILVFAGFTLGINTFFTVLGTFVLRRTQPELERPYRTPLYPLPPLIFLAFTGWTLGYILLQRPEEGLLGLGIILSGTLFYLGTVWSGKRRAGISGPGAGKRLS